MMNELDERFLDSEFSVKLLMISASIHFGIIF